MLMYSLLLLAASPAALSGEVAVATAAGAAASAAMPSAQMAPSPVSASVDSKTPGSSAPDKGRGPTRKTGFRAVLGVIVTVLGASIL